ncbi:MAG: hypothetical protein ACOC2H_04510 [Spirochaetota bacterium]
MKKKLQAQELVKMLRSERRPLPKPPKAQTPKTAYNRKVKHKRRYRDDASSFFYAA